MNHLWHMRVDGEYVYSVYCQESDLEEMKNGFLVACRPLNEPVVVDITFQKVDPSEYELQTEDSD